MRMNKLLIPSIAAALLLATVLFSCAGEGNSFEQIPTLETIQQRIPLLNKSMVAVKKTEEKAALTREQDDLLEYEYPIREDESYVVTYRFDDAGCFEIGLDTYLNTQKEAKNVMDGVLKILAEEPSYGEPTKETD